MLRANYDVIAVADGRAALDAARAQRPDLILGDVALPRLDWFVLVRKLRALPPDFRVRLFFRDNGVGIAKKAQEKIFRIFYQTEPGHSGTGIGLAVVRKAVERMGGSVSVESDLRISEPRVCTHCAISRFPCMPVKTVPVAAVRRASGDRAC